MNKKLTAKIKILPQKPGAYLFKDESGRILYVGKAINLKNRVRSHFVKGTTFYRKEWITNIADIDHIKTANEKQALLLENQLIKKYQPRYNIQWRDDKSYFWVEITNEQWPKVKVVHKPNITTLAPDNNSPSFRRNVGTLPPLSLRGGLGELPRLIGPFTNGTELKQVLRALRKIFPYRTCKNSYDKPCLQWHLGLCPAHRSIGEGGPAHKNPPPPSLKRGSKIFPPPLGGVGGDLNQRYRKSLITLRQFLRLYAGEPIRIEAYDISNIHGAHATGSMIVFAGDKPKKSDWRRFKIQTIRGANDVAMLKEVLRRRLNHPEWPHPDLIIIDGGQAQLNAASKIIKAHKLILPVVALAKKEEEIYTEYSKKTLKLRSLPLPLQLVFQAIRNEAHRFAIFYYRHLHGKTLRPRTATKKARKKS